MSFSHTVLGNCFLETSHGCYETHPSSLQIETQSKLLHYTWIDAKDCTIVKTHVFFITNLNLNTNMWNFFFYGSRYQEGTEEGCIYINPEQHNTLISYHIEFECRSKTFEYESLVQGLKKAIDIKVKCL